MFFFVVFCKNNNVNFLKYIFFAIWNNFLLFNKKKESFVFLFIWKLLCHYRKPSIVCAFGYGNFWCVCAEWTLRGQHIWGKIDQIKKCLRARMTSRDTLQGWYIFTSSFWSSIHTTTWTKSVYFSAKMCLFIRMEDDEKRESRTNNYKELVQKKLLQERWRMWGLMRPGNFDDSEWA